jgi:hypothetical protein
MVSVTDSVSSNMSCFYCHRVTVNNNAVSICHVVVVYSSEFFFAVISLAKGET